MRQLILCADDFAMSAEASAAIVRLAAAGKLNAISCMAVSKRWREDSFLLADLPSSVQLGLHLVLTDEEPLTQATRLAPAGRLPSSERLSRMALLRRLPRDELVAEVSAQFDQFSRWVGRAPDFVDGHQHTHVLPVVRDIVLRETFERNPNAWIRSCHDRMTRILQRPFRFKALVNSIQSRSLRRSATSSGLRCNDSFSGLYDFKSEYGELFPSFLRSPGQFHLVICHPSSGRLAGDRIAEARVREAEVLRISAIGELAAAQGLSFG